MSLIFDLFTEKAVLQGRSLPMTFLTDHYEGRFKHSVSDFAKVCRGMGGITIQREEGTVTAWYEPHVPGLIPGGRKELLSYLKEAQSPVNFRLNARQGSDVPVFFVGQDFISLLEAFFGPTGGEFDFPPDPLKEGVCTFTPCPEEEDEPSPEEEGLGSFLTLKEFKKIKQDEKDRADKREVEFLSDLIKHQILTSKKKTFSLKSPHGNRKYNTSASPEARATIVGGFSEVAEVVFSPLLSSKNNEPLQPLSFHVQITLNDSVL